MNFLIKLHEGEWLWDGPFTLNEALDFATYLEAPWGPNAAIVRVHIDGTISVLTIAEAQEETQS